MYLDESRDSQGDYEQRLAGLRRGEVSESLYVDMRGSTRSMGTISSGVNASLVREGRKPAEIDSRPRSHIISTSPPLDSRITQSADSMLLDDRLSPSSLPGLGSPRFPPDSHPSFVSDYVAFGRTRPAPDSPNKPTDFIPQFAREQERLTANLQASHSQIVSLENYKTEALIRTQTLEREKKHLEERCRILAKDLQEVRKIEEMVGDLGSFRSRFEAFEAGKEGFVREIATLRHENGQKQGKIDELVREERRLRDQLSQRNDECHNLKKERLRLLKDFDESQRFQANLERNLRENAAEREKLKGKCKELELALQVSEDQVGESREIEGLQRQIAEKDRKLKEFEDKTRRENDKRGRSEGRKPTKYPLNRDDSAENRGKSPHCQRILREIMVILGISHRRDIIPRLKSLQDPSKRAESAVNLAEKLISLVIQHSPPHTFPNPPTYEELEAWVDRLISEYLVLRKGEAQSVVTALVSRLGVGKVGAVAEAVERLIAENRELRGKGLNYL